MHRHILAIVLFAVAGAAPPAAGDELRNVQVGEAVPPFTVATLTGDELRSADRRGRVQVIAYVAAEQRSSEEVTAQADRVVRGLRDREIDLVLLTADVTRLQHFRELRDRLQVHAPLGLDIGRRVYGDLGLIVLPTTIVVDREGRLARVISSAKPDYAQVLDAAARHALGLIDDAELARRLSAAPVEHNRPEDRVARHRAAARQLRHGGLDEDAERELRAALAILADDAGAALDLASLYVARGRHDEAGALADAVLAGDPDHRRALLVRGVVLFHLDRLDEAAPLLEQALLLNTDPAWTHYYLGRLHERRGDAAKANEHYREALDRILRGEPL